MTGYVKCQFCKKLNVFDSYVLIEGGYMSVNGAENIMITDNNNSNQQYKGGRSLYYEFEGAHCPRCVKHWKIDQQIPYTTKNGTRKYNICPQCRIKQPLRKSPRHKKFYNIKNPSKRIDGA